MSESFFYKATMFVVIAAVVLFAAAYVLAAPPEHEASWSQAVELEYIDGNPAYYYNGQASLQEYAHALIVAQLETSWVPTPNGDEANPATYCEDKLWEYRNTPGDGYWPQTFASDSDRYDSITLFDNHYPPVTFLWPSAGRVYEHPAGGYDRLVVCWTDKA